MGFYGKQVWVASGSLSHDSGWWKEADPSINCTRDQLEMVIQNMLIVDNMYFNTDEQEQGLTGMSVERFRKVNCVQVLKYMLTQRTLFQPLLGPALARKWVDVNPTLEQCQIVPAVGQRCLHGTTLK